MPISKYFGGHGSEVMHNMTREYGAKKGKSVFYATANKRNQKPKSEETESADAQPVSESARDILQAIKTKNWHAANEAFSSAISQKIADRLALERKSIFKEESGCICKEPLNLTPDEWKRKSKDSKGVHRDANGKIAYRTCLRYCPVHGTTLAPVNIVKGTVKEAFEVPEVGELVKDKIGHTYKVLQIEGGGYRFLVDVGYDTPQGWRSANGKPVWMGRSELRLSEGTEWSGKPEEEGGETSLKSRIAKAKANGHEGFKSAQAKQDWLKGKNGQSDKGISGFQKESLASEPSDGDAIRELGAHEADIKEEAPRCHFGECGAKGCTGCGVPLKKKPAVKEANDYDKSSYKNLPNQDELIAKNRQAQKERDARIAAKKADASKVNEEHMPTSEVQRVYDEVRDVPETELLCGIRQLKVNNKGDVVSYVSEAIVREGSEAAVQTGFTKKAVIRDPSAPIGQPADMYLNCVCGNRVDMGKSTEYPGKGGTCSKCGQKYDARGYMIEGLTEGRDRTFRYSVQLFTHGGYNTPSGWDVKGTQHLYGKNGSPAMGAPNDANLAKYVKAYNDSLAPGGVNDHIGERGRAYKAEIRDGGINGTVVATWRAPSFEVR